METSGLKKEEILGVLAALLLHVALVLVLMQKPEPVDKPPKMESVTVSLSENIALETASPTPVPQSRQAEAPQLADTLTPPQTAPKPAVSKPAPRAAARARPRPKPQSSPATRPKPPAQPRQTSSSRKGGASNIGSNFLSGAGNTPKAAETRPPAPKFGRAESAALGQAFNRQLRPHWRAPQGLEADRIVTVLSWRLNKDGSIASAPRVVRQTGITAANRAQASLHAERAKRAVILAAPFKLPPEFYDKWKYVRDYRFDRRL